MIERGLCRKMINNHVCRVKRVFKWAVAEELVPPHMYHGLMALTSLAATNLFPVFFDEFRVRTCRRDLSSIYREWRSVYGGEIEQRCTSSLAVKQYPLCAPVMIAVEDRPRDAALDHRILPLNLRPSDLEVEARKQAFDSMKLIGTMAANGVLRYGYDFTTTNGKLVIPPKDVIPQAKRYARETDHGQTPLGIEAYRAMLRDAAEREGHYVLKTTGAARFTDRSGNGSTALPAWTATTMKSRTARRGRMLHNHSARARQCRH